MKISPLCDNGDQCALHCRGTGRIHPYASLDWSLLRPMCIKTHTERSFYESPRSPVSYKYFTNPPGKAPSSSHSLHLHHIHLPNQYTNMFFNIKSLTTMVLVVAAFAVPNPEPIERASNSFDAAVEGKDVSLLQKRSDFQWRFCELLSLWLYNFT